MIHCSCGQSWSCRTLVKQEVFDQVSTKRLATAATSARCRAQAKYNGDEDSKIPKAPKRTDIDQLVVEPGLTYVDEMPPTPGSRFHVH